MKTGKPSSTARLIARSMILLGKEKKYSHLVNFNSVRLNQFFTDEYSGSRDRLVRMMDILLIRKILFQIERLILKGIILHYALRKKSIREIIDKSIEEKFNQVIILGAGFDTLSFQLKDSYPDVKLFEFDFPATQDVKLKALQKNKEDTSGIEFFPYNLQDSNFKNFLDSSSPKISADQPTVILAEGLLMYLREDEIKKLFQAINSFFKGSVRMIFTFIETDSNGNPNFYTKSTFVQSFLQWKKEPFLWGIKKESLPSFVKTEGFLVKEIFHPEDKIHLADSHENTIGELICVMDKSN